MLHQAKHLVLGHLFSSRKRAEQGSDRSGGPIPMTPPAASVHGCCTLALDAWGWMGKAWSCLMPRFWIAMWGPSQVIRSPTADLGVPRKHEDSPLSELKASLWWAHPGAQSGCIRGRTDSRTLLKLRPGLGSFAQGGHTRSSTGMASDCWWILQSLLKLKEVLAVGGPGGHDKSCPWPSSFTPSGGGWYSLERVSLPRPPSVSLIPAHLLTSLRSPWAVRLTRFPVLVRPHPSVSCLLPVALFASGLIPISLLLVTPDRPAI